MTRLLCTGLTLAITLIVAPVAPQTDTSRVIAFGTLLKPHIQMAASQQLAKSLANPAAPQWRAKGDQRRTYRLPDANVDVAYRVCVPTNWDGASKLPLIMFLHGAGNDESSYLDQNNKQMVNLAAGHGFILVSPLGYGGAYGTMIRLPAVFGQQAEADKMIAARTPEIERTQQISEKDVINVLELVLNEYPVERGQMYLTGHSMGSGGTWYHGAKYRAYWAAMAPMSGPFVQESGYAWDSIRTMPVFMTEGTGATPSLAGSRLLRDWMVARGFALKYKEVNADHGGMVPLVLPDVFAFFDSCRNHSVAVSKKTPMSFTDRSTGYSARYLPGQGLRIAHPSPPGSSGAMMSVVDISGRIRFAGAIDAGDGTALRCGVMLPAGAYRAFIKTAAGNGCAAFSVVR